MEVVMHLNKEKRPPSRVVRIGLILLTIVLLTQAIDPALRIFFGIDYLGVEVNTTVTINPGQGYIHLYNSSLGDYSLQLSYNYSDSMEVPVTTSYRARRDEPLPLNYYVEGYQGEGMNSFGGGQLILFVCTVPCMVASHQIDEAGNHSYHGNFYMNASAEHPSTEFVSADSSYVVGDISNAYDAGESNAASYGTTFTTTNVLMGDPDYTFGDVSGFQAYLTQQVCNGQVEDTEQNDLFRTNLYHIVDTMQIGELTTAYDINCP